MIIIQNQTKTKFNSPVKQGMIQNPPMSTLSQSEALEAKQNNNTKPHSNRNNNILVYQSNLKKIRINTDHKFP